MSYQFTSESVSEGHPDKVCDFIADSVLDACLEQDPNSRVACEVLCKGRDVVLAGEINSNALVDHEMVARRAIRALVRAHGGRNPRVFGSAARGDDRPESDIDFVVDFDFDDRGIFPLFDLRDALSELLGERVDVVASSFLKPEVAEGVERDGIRI